MAVYLGLNVLWFQDIGKNGKLKFIKLLTYLDKSSPAGILISIMSLMG